MAEPTNQSAILRVASFFRASDIRRPVPERIWSQFPNISAGERPQITEQARAIVAASQQIELAGNGGSAKSSLTLYPDSDTVEYRVRVKFTREDGSTHYRTYRNKTSSLGGTAGIVEDIEGFISDMSNRYGWSSYTILFDSLIVWSS